MTKPTVNTPAPPHAAADIVAAPIPSTLRELDAQIAALDVARRDPSLEPHTFAALSSKLEQLRVHRDPIAAAESHAAGIEAARRRREAFERAYDAELLPLEREHQACVARHVELVRELVANVKRAQELNDSKRAAWLKLQSADFLIGDDPARPLPRVIGMTDGAPPPTDFVIFRQSDADVVGLLRSTAIRDVFGGSLKNVPGAFQFSLPVHSDA